MSSVRCLTQRYPWCTLCTTGSSVPLSGMTARYLPKLLAGRKKMNVVRATCIVKFPLCILFLCWSSLSFLWMNLLWC